MQTVAITGATGTLGKAIAQRFVDGALSDSWKLALWSNAGAQIELECSERCSVIVANTDLLSVESEKSVVSQLGDLNHIDALVTCAGVSLVKPSLEMTADEWRHVIDVNLTGTFLSIREAVKVGATRIVTIGSIHGSTPTSYPQRAAYAASKAGVVGLTQSLAVELAPQGVAINCVAPGHLPVLMDGTGAGADLLNAAKARTPAGKLTTAQETAEVVYWLCSSAPLSMTGQVLTVSGGYELNTWPGDVLK